LVAFSFELFYSTDSSFERSGKGRAQKGEEVKMEKRIEGFRRYGIWQILAVLGIFLTTLAWADEKKVISAIDEVSANCKDVSQKIFEWKEPGYQEFKSSQLLMEELRKLGYKVTGDLKVPTNLVKEGVLRTAFRAEMVGNRSGSTIVIMLEYDALPNGHSCGHNLIATSGLLAAAGLAGIMPETPGRVVILGTPAEETGPRGGKIFLLEGGHFEGTDVVLITHPSDRWNAIGQFLASKMAIFTFKGKASHAAAAPHSGINALNAVIHTFNGINLLRGHLRQDVRIHGIITKGGETRNIVPDVAQCDFSVRALDVPTLEDAYQKVVDCAKAGALATGATLEFEPPRTSLKSPINIPFLTKMVTERVKSLGVSEEEIKPTTELASSDLGNVGHVYPTVNLWFKIASEGTPLHSDVFREAAASEAAWKATVLAGKAIALTAYDLLTHAEKVKTIHEQFKDQKAKEGR
jgi:amidohydrolase